ncbi:MAG: hypothetical protein ACFE9L_17425 [Candidatus Hodarchaeota archaeon]
MFKRKENQWLLKAQSTEFPLSLQDFRPSEYPKVIASFLRKKIGSKELDGFVSPDDQFYIPNRFVLQSISRQLKINGVVDICDLIDETNLPGEVLEHQVLQSVQHIDGFWDLIRRKFFTPQGSFAEIRKLLSGSPALDLKYLLNELYWSEEHLEAILDLMAQEGYFTGYIDPLKQRLYNFTNLDFSTPINWPKNMKHLSRYINTTFLLESEVALSNISNLTRLSEEKCLEVLDKNRSGISFVFSKDFQYLYPTMDILDQVLKDIFVYQSIPISFWQQRLDIDRSDLLNLLRILNPNLERKIRKDDFDAPSLRNWLDTGLNIEGIATGLNLSSHQVLDLIFKLGKTMGFKLIAGETADPFLVRGVEHFNIFCQVDTSSYIDPHLYFECQNCKRVICSNCRSTGSKHECPFCGNISAFIIDLPRYCPHCKVNYTHSSNLLSTEKCYFCKKGPLKSGWIEESIEASEQLDLDSELLKFLQKTHESEIPLKQVFSLLNKSDAEAVAYLEHNILHGIIQGKINIRKMTLHLSTKRLEFICNICENSFTETENYFCINCGEKVCTNCFSEMNSVGMTFCPGCGDSLIENSRE